jgi:hypothetical protein
MAQAILDRTDISSIVIQAVRSELPAEARPARRGSRAVEKGARDG